MLFFCEKCCFFLRAEGEKLWVVTNFTKEASKPQLNRSIVHFYAGEVAYYKKGDEKLVVEGKIKYKCL